MAEESIDNTVDASFNIEMESATDLKITCELTVDKITLSGSGATYTGDEISVLETTNQLILGAIAQELSVALDNTLSESFQNADVVALQVLPTYSDGKFHAEFTVNLTSVYFGMGETINAHDFLNGVLDMGAKLDYIFNFNAQLGWNDTYVIELGGNIGYQRTNGEVDGNIITWIVRNGVGNNPSLAAELTILYNSPTTSSSETDDVFLEFKLDASGEKTSLTYNVLAKTINIDVYGILPDFITNLTYVPADGIRLLIDNGFISWDDFNQTTIRPIKEKIKPSIETPLFNQTIEMISDWDNETAIDCQIPYEIDNMDNEPPIKIILTDENIELKIYGITSRALFGLANSGALANVSNEDINFGGELSSVGYPYNISILLPEGITLEQENEYVWNDSIAFSGDFSSEGSPDYHSNEINTIIEIEFQSSDLNLLSFFTGNTELNFGLELTENKNYNVSTIPEEFSLPEKITLDYLNSDAFRLCFEEEVFSETETNAFLKNNKDSFQNRLNKGILPGLGASCKIGRSVFDKSLAWDGDISNMDAEKAVIVSSYAHGSYPVSFSFSFLPPKVDIPTRKINLTGLPDQSVTYRMIFPQGMVITASDTLNKTLVEKTKDGRYYFEITFDASEHNLTTEVSLKMIPSALFTVGLFMPCIISFFITIILIIVIIILRKKRKGKKTAIVVQEEDASGYEDQDYYVPPPPSSK